MSEIVGGNGPQQNQRLQCYESLSAVVKEVVEVGLEAAKEAS